MKIKYVVQNYSKLIKLQLLKIKSYKKSYVFINLKIEDIEYRLIKGLRIIYKYIVNNKKLLFLNNFFTIETKLKNLLKKKLQTYISKYLRFSKIVVNKKKNLLNVKQENNIRNYKILILKNKNNLILLNKQFNKTDLIESYKIKIPTIFIINKLIDFDFRLSYKILGDYLYRKNKFFFLFVLLNSIMKK